MRWLAPRWMKSPNAAAELTDPVKLKEVLLHSSNPVCRLIVLRKMDDEPFLASVLETEKEINLLTELLRKIWNRDLLLQALKKNPDDCAKRMIFDKLLRSADLDDQYQFCLDILDDADASPAFRKYVSTYGGLDLVNKRLAERKKDREKKELEYRRIHCSSSPTGSHDWEDVPDFRSSIQYGQDHQMWYTQKKCRYCGMTEEEPHIVFTDY